jgi:diaminohydroxyphosphoribosylaminopyrimidine deaminase/5-amino-6-(5-phosphoribosylamino)uracil reductase
MSEISRETVERFMKEALDLAARGRFRVEPNPCVGAIVLAADGSVAGRGFHGRWGGPHAEAEALTEAGVRARGGTLIVTLEPCANEGKKTPPCAPRVVGAGVARVVAGCEDANPATFGRAANAFAAAGIRYETGVLRDECVRAISRYERHLALDRPWIAAKWAMSMDGRIADAAGAARWISGERSREIVHELRGAADAVIVGRGTVDADDPSLTSRVPGGRDPLRVVVDSMLSVDPAAKVVATARETATLVICSDRADAVRRTRLESLGVVVAAVASDGPGRVSVDGVVRELARRGVRRALLESGGRLTGSFLRAGLVDQAAVFVAPMLLGAGPSPGHGAAWPIAEAPRLLESRVSAVGDDALIEGYWPR